MFARGALGGELYTRLTGRVARRGSVPAIASRACEPRVFPSPATHRDCSHPGTQRAQLPRRPGANEAHTHPDPSHGSTAGTAHVHMRVEQRERCCLEPLPAEVFSRSGVSGQWGWCSAPCG
jgi:hypothetical protein